LRGTKLRGARLWRMPQASRQCVLPLNAGVMKETIKRIDAAQRQLDCAIKLWFNYADAISTHTLACSAHQIIHEISEGHKNSKKLFDNIYIKDEHRSRFISVIKNSYNFFKHANRDPDPESTIEFDSSLTEFFILFTIFGIESLGYEIELSSKIFFAYFFIHNPGFITSEGHELFLKGIPIDKLENIRNVDRKEFFKYAFLLLCNHDKSPI